VLPHRKIISADREKKERLIQLIAIRGKGVKRRKRELVGRKQGNWKRSSFTF